MLTSGVRAAWRYRDLLVNLVLRDLRVRYKGSTLGFAWSLLHPLLMAAVYTLAFKYVIRLRVEHFPLFLLAGLLPWTFFAGAVGAATNSVADNSPLVRKVAFPRVILPLASVASEFTRFVLMYAVIMTGGAWLTVGLSPALAALVPLILLQLAFTAGLALVASTAYVHFRDMRHLVDVLLQVWFWATPVVYPLALVPEQFRAWTWLNPMTIVVDGCHQAVVERAWPPAWGLAALAGFAALALAVGALIFFRYERRFAELV